MEKKLQTNFTKNVLILMSGTTIAQAIPIAISPILTRIYTPEDFGLFTVFLAITTILGSVANGRYEMAIILPRKDENAINILALGLLINFVFSILILILIIFFNENIIELLGNDEITIWLYFMPISIFLVGFFNLLTYYNNRKKYYKDIAKSVIIKSIVLALVQLSIGMLKEGAHGLISGQIVSQFFSNLLLIRNILKNNNYLILNKKKMFLLLLRYIDFLRFSVPSTLLNMMNLHFFNLLISSIYSFSTLGFYSLVQRVLSLPTLLIGNSIGQVFLEESSREMKDTKSSIKSFVFTFKKLCTISIPFFICMYFAVEEVFIFVFGKEWELAGVYAKILVPLFFIRFISASLSVILVVYEKQKLELSLNIILFSTSLICIMLNNDFQDFLYSLVIFLSLNYFVFILYYYSLALKGSK